MPAQVQPSDPDLLLLQTWAPLMVLHPDEQYFPAAVDWYLSRVRLLNGYNEPVTSFAQNGATLADTALNERVNWTLDILDPATRTGDKANLATVPCYGYIRPVFDPSGTQVAKDLNYWFFYPFNGNIFDINKLVGFLNSSPIQWGSKLLWVLPGGNLVSLLISKSDLIAALYAGDGLGQHEGDWEGVTVRLNMDGSFQKLFMTAHKDGNTTANYTPVSDTDNRPIVYVANSSHANYPTKGTQTRVGGFANDSTDEGQHWDLQSTVINVGWNANATQSVAWVPCAPVPLQVPGVLPPAPVLNDIRVAINNVGDVVYSGTIPSTANPKQKSYAAVQECFGLDPSGNLVLVPPVGAGKDFGQAGWNSGGLRTHFPDGDSTCAVAINDAGTAMAAVVVDGQIVWNLGDVTIYGLRWILADSRQLKDDMPANPPPNVIGNPSVVINKDNIIMLAYLNSSGQYIYYLATFDPQAVNTDYTTAGVTWQATPISNKDIGNSDPSIAMNALGMIVSVRSSNNALYYSLGQYHSGSQTFNWWITNVKYGVGNNPQVSINDDGLVMEVHETDGMLYYHIGQLTIEQPGRQATVVYIEWLNTTIFNPTQGASFGRTNSNPSTALCAGLTLATDSTSQNAEGLPTIAVQAAADGWQLGSIDVNNFANWQPLNGQAWMKYSGHWGNKATHDLLEFLDEALSEITPGPTGPAYKSSWISGPKASS